MKTVNKRGWVPPLKYVLLGAMLFAFLVMCAMFDGAMAETFFTESLDSDFINLCLEGCNKTVGSYSNVNDNLWGNATPTLYYIIRHSESTEYAVMHWARKLDYSQNRLIPESLVLKGIMLSQNDPIPAQIIFSPDNLTWYLWNFTTSASLNNFLEYSNLTQDHIIDFINSSGWFNIFVKPNQTATSDGLEVRGFQLDGSVYAASEKLLTNCTNPAHTRVMSIYIKDETVNSNILGYFENTQFDYYLTNNTYREQAIYWGSENVTHNLCVYGWTPPYPIVNMFAVYTASGYSQRSWYLYSAQIPETLAPINVYLINTTLDDQIAIHVTDENQNAKGDAEVRLLRWIPPSYTAVTIMRTNSEGRAFTYADLDEWYKFQVLYEGTLYYTSEPTQLVGIDTGSSPVELEVNFGTANPYFQWMNGTSYSATWNRVTEVYTFTVADGTGLMTSGSVAADQINLTGQKRVCWNNSTSSSFTITCDLSTYSNGTYALNAWLIFGTDKFVVNSSIIYIGLHTTELSNQDGLVMSMIFVGTAAMLGIFHPVLMIIFTMLGLVAVGILQLSLIGLEYILPVVFVGIILIFIIRRKSQ